MTKQEIESKVTNLKPWYHKIQLPHGIVTPGEPYDHIWDNIRKSREHIDYSGKRVLDLASLDGMWSFEAESLGAELVIAADCAWASYQNFLFCKHALSSSVVPLYNVPPHEIVLRLDSYLQGVNVHFTTPRSIAGQTPKFDIVHHTGLFYHLINPVMSLQQCKSVIKTGGKLLVETACTYSDELTMRFSHHKKNEIYRDETTWWAPSIPCLRAILDTCGFRVEESSVNYIGSTSETGKESCFGRVALVATSVDPSEMDQDVLRELMHHYRTPGLVL